MTTLEERVRQARMASTTRREMAEALGYLNVEHLHRLLRRFNLPLFGKPTVHHSEEAKRTVIDAYVSGKPQKEISDTTGVPISSIIGILQRAGVWKRKERKVIWRNPQAPKPQIQNRIAIIPKFKVDPFTPRVADLTPLHLDLLDLKRGQCHYPYGEDKITFCGHATNAGASYCEAHHAIAYSPAKARNRKPRPR